jgi:hypothetical protein
MERIPLSVETAEITTAAVEIKTLTVRGKQVTLALFRQLEEITLMSSRDGSLAGVPWGWVNYHPDKSCPSAGHIHVVWQKGNALYRSAVVTEEYYYDKVYPQEVVWDQWLMFYIEGYKGFELDTMEVRREKLTFTIDEVEFRTSIPDYSIKRDGENITWSSMKPRLQVEELKSVDAEEVKQKVAESVKKELKRRELLENAYATITELPQLFIAV